MNMWEIPWLTVAVLVALVGAGIAAIIHNRERAFAWSVGVATVAFGCAGMAWWGHYVLERPFPAASWFGVSIPKADWLSTTSALLITGFALLTIMSTGWTKITRFSLSCALAGMALQVAAVSSTCPWLFLVMLAVSTIPPGIVLLQRGQSIRVYAIHMALCLILLTLGWWGLDSRDPSQAIPTWAMTSLVIGVLILGGALPFHCWVTEWFERGSFGNSLMWVTPLLGAYAMVRLVWPIAPEWALQIVTIVALPTAVYSAGMATIQQDIRRFFAFLFLSQGSLVLVGLSFSTPIVLTGALALWFAVIPALGGLGLVLRAIEARFGKLQLDRYHGLYDHSPALGIGFLLLGLASVGFPGMVGFVAGEMLVNGVVSTNLVLGIGIVIVAAINGIAVVRAYLLLYTGARPSSSIPLWIGTRERIVGYALLTLILVGGLWPQPGIKALHRSAESLVQQRTPHSTPDESNKKPHHGE